MASRVIAGEANMHDRPTCLPASTRRTYDKESSVIGSYTAHHVHVYEVSGIVMFITVVIDTRNSVQPTPNKLVPVVCPHKTPPLS